MASLVDQYVARLDEARKAEVLAIDKLVREAAPELEPAMTSGMLGYGPVHYRYATGHEGDTCRIVVASRKNYISIYVCGGDENGYLAEQFKSKLPRADIGKGCVRFKRLGDLDAEALKELLGKAAVCAIPS